MATPFRFTSVSPTTFELYAAAGMHLMCHTLVKEAVATGRLDIAEHHLSHHDECRFGRWLATDGVRSKGAQTYRERVAALHAGLHRSLHTALDDVRAGRRTAAAAAVSKTGHAGEQYHSLLETLTAWRFAH